MFLYNSATDWSNPAEVGVSLQWNNNYINYMYLKYKTHKRKKYTNTLSKIILISQLALPSCSNSSIWICLDWITLNLPISRKNYCWSFSSLSTISFSRSSQCNCLFGPLHCLVSYMHYRHLVHSELRADFTRGTWQFDRNFPRKKKRCSKVKLAHHYTLLLPKC